MLNFLGLDRRAIVQTRRLGLGSELFGHCLDSCCQQVSRGAGLSVGVPFGCACRSLLLYTRMQRNQAQGHRLGKGQLQPRCFRRPELALI